MKLDILVCAAHPDDAELSCSGTIAQHVKMGKKVGVIDFDCYMISDPARDFEVFFDFGREYAKMAYEKYTGKKDPRFLKRAENYYKAHGIYTLLSTQLGAKIFFNNAYKNFFKKKFGE